MGACHLDSPAGEQRNEQKGAGFLGTRFGESIDGSLTKPPPEFQITPRNNEAKLAGALPKRK